MSEIGQEAPKNSIIDQLQVAKKALQKDNDHPARETVGSISDEVSHQIEHGESSNDPLAYSLKSVVIIEPNPKMGYLTYLLEPPIGTEADQRIKMVYVTQGNSPYSSGLTFLDRDLSIDPYGKFAQSRARRIERLATEANLAFLNDIEKVYSDIAAHGIRKNPADFTAIHRGDPLSPEFDQYVKSQPFSGKLEFYTEPQEPKETRVPSEKDIAPPSTHEIAMNPLDKQEQVETLTSIVNESLFEQQRQLEAERMKTLAQQTLAVADQIIDKNGLSRESEGNTLFTLFHGSPRRASLGLKSLEEIIKEGNDINNIDIDFRYITDIEYTTPERGLLDAFGKDKSDKYGYPKPDQIALNLTKEFLTRLNFPLENFRKDTKGNPYMIDLARSCKVLVKRSDNGSRILGFGIEKVSLPPPGYH